ncbi:MAG: M24 family metallopeptidase, partial [Paracoccaceae bacterium]|nr:M24 family metallopeptidase [Paracoccaceae bacterium]
MNDQHRGRLTRDGIRIHEDGDFAGMHRAGQVAAAILDEIAEFVQPGITTAELDRIIEDKVEATGAKSATIGYKGYQHSSCISLN